MKTHHRHLTHLSHHRKLAFTLVELMMASAIFLVVSVGVMVGFQIFGLRVYTLSATKMVATADARKTLNALRQQIRSAKIIFVGNYANGSFNRIPNGQPQTGNALQIYFADTNDAPNQVPVIFYQNAAAANVCSCSNGLVQVLANYVTNNYVFTAEDYLANTISDYNNNPVICVTMQFYQWEYPIGFIGTNALNAYNHYRLQTRISRRLKE
jgi:prepilin-type N-terminal cleavage/methylation domain-containing protein